MLRTMGTTTSTAFGSGKHLGIFLRRHLAFSNTLFIIHQLEESQMMWNVQAGRWVGRCALWDGESFRLSETDLRKYFACQNFNLRKSSKIFCLSETDLRKSLEIFVHQKLIWENHQNILFVIWENQTTLFMLFMLVRNWFDEIKNIILFVRHWFDLNQWNICIYETRIIDREVGEICKFLLRINSHDWLSRQEVAWIHAPARLCLN